MHRITSSWSAVLTALATLALGAAGVAAALGHLAQQMPGANCPPMC